MKPSVAIFIFCFCFVVVDAVYDDDDVVVFVAVLSQKPSIKSLAKIGSVIDEMLFLLFLLLSPPFLVIL